MTRDDRDIESGNPSKSFKLGEFDRLSGFFTPVWESKRRVHSESPAPPSSSDPKAARGSLRSAEAKQVKVTTPAGSSAAATLSSPLGEARAQPQSPLSMDPSAPQATAAGVTTQPATDEARTPPGEGARSGGAAQAGEARRDDVAPSHDDIVPPPARDAISPASAAATAAVEALAPEDQLASDVSAEGASAQAPTLPPSSLAAERVNTSLQGRARHTGAVLSKPPGAALVALQNAGPNLGPDAFLDREPEVRAPRAAGADNDRSPQELRREAHQRSLRASAAATRVHEQLRSRAASNGSDALRVPRATDTDREALAAIAAARPAEESSGADSIHLLRRLRRTIHLSTPLPDSVRAMIARYGRH